MMISNNPHTNYFSPSPHLRVARFSELTTAVSRDYPALETGPGCIIEFVKSLPGSRDHHTTDLSPQAAEGRKLKLTLVRISSKNFPIGLNVLHSPTQASLGAVSHRLTSSSSINVFTHENHIHGHGLNCHWHMTLSNTKQSWFLDGWRLSLSV